MSLVRNLMQSSFQNEVNTSDLERSFGEIHEGFLDDAFVEMMEGLVATDRAYYMADIIGSCRVVTEGAEPTTVMENVIKSGIDRLISLWTKLLAQIRAFFEKMVQLVKSMVLSGKKFVDEFGPKIRERVRNTKNFSLKYKGYKYDTTAGDNLADTYTGQLNNAMSKVVDGLDSAGTLTGDQIMQKVGVKSEKDRVSGAEYLEKVIKDIAADCTTISDLQDKVREAFRGDTATGERTISAGDVEGMLKYVANAKTTMDRLNKDKKAQETLCTNVIRKLKAIQKPKADEKDDKYETASAMSQWLTAILNAYRSMVNCRVNMTKEASNAQTSILRKILNYSDKKLTSEGTLFEEDDIDLDDIEIDEAAIAGADEPEGDTNDIGIVKEGCDKKCATEEGCSTDKDPLEEAMQYL